MSRNYTRANLQKVRQTSSDRRYAEHSRFTACQSHLSEDCCNATRTRCVLVTEDSDFVRLSQVLRPHAGIVYFPVQLSIGSCVEYLELLALTTNPQEMLDQLVYGRW